MKREIEKTASVVPIPDPGSGNLTKAISAFLSITCLVVLNIIVSGHLLSYVFDIIESKEDKTHLSLSIPFVCNLSVKGKSAIAGLSSFLISLLIVVMFLSAYAEKLFIETLQSTDSTFVASQALAAFGSFSTSLALAVLKYCYLKFSAYPVHNNISADSEIITTLTNPKKNSR